MCNPYLLHSTGILLSTFQGRHITLVGGILHLLNLVFYNYCHKVLGELLHKIGKVPIQCTWC